MAKLIRDGLANVDWPFLPQGKEFVRSVTGVDEHIALLVQKLLEEGGELLTAPAAKAEEEAGDLMEVISGLLMVRYGASFNRALSIKAEKYTARGGFEKGTVWDI